MKKYRVSDAIVDLLKNTKCDHPNFAELLEITDDYHSKTIEDDFGSLMKILDLMTSQPIPLDCILAIFDESVVLAKKNVQLLTVSKFERLSFTILSCSSASKIND